MAFRDRVKDGAAWARRAAPEVGRWLREVPSLLAGLRDIPLILRSLRWGLEGRLVLLVTAACWIPCLILWLLCTWSLRQSYTGGFRTLLQSLSSQYAVQVDNWLDDQQQAAAGLARSATLLRLLKANDLNSLTGLLADTRQTHPWFEEIRLVRPNRRTLVSNLGRSSGNALMGSWVQTALTRPTSISPSVRNGEFWATATVAGPDRARPLGLLCCKLNLRTLEANLNPVAPAVGAGRSADGPRSDRQETRPDDALTKDVFLIVRGEAGKVEEREDGIPAAALRGKLTAANFDLNGTAGKGGSVVLSSWEPVADTAWTVLVQVPRSQLITSFLMSLFLSLLIAVCLGLFCASLGLLLARRLLNPLARLTSAAQAIADGHRNVRVAMLRGDEIGELANTFDRMAGHLEVTVTQLETARDQALSAFSSKSRFLANMTHELRTPLNSIIGYSEMLMGEAEDAGQTQTVEDLQVIREAGRDLLVLINSILDLSKLEAGKLALDLETFALADLFKEIAQIFTPLLREQGNTMAQEPLLDKRDLVRMDRQKLKQMLVNLVSNANKFTRNGHITLRARLAGEAFERLELEVEDSGIGMTVEQCTHIFDEFSQADESTTRKFGGTGLGLTIVQRFAELMGGRVDVYSELDKGSLFRISLPRPAVP